jgi:hypothetical protein
MAATKFFTFDGYANARADLEHFLKPLKSFCLGVPVEPEHSVLSIDG